MNYSYWRTLRVSGIERYDAVYCSFNKNCLMYFGILETQNKGETNL